MSTAKKPARAAGICISILILLILLVTTCETAFYSSYGWYIREYNKCGVPEDLKMTEDNLEQTTRYMMRYLRGQEEELSFSTTVRGHQRDFFNDEERTHMADVRMLFVGALRLRLIAVLLAVLIAACALLRKKELFRTLPRTYLKTELVFTIFAGLLVFAMSRNFSRAFIIFHKIFFFFDSESNWLLDYGTSNLIHMLPEQFFADMGLRIAMFLVIYLAGSAALAGVLARMLSRPGADKPRT